MDIGCIARCISLAVFAASLQALAQPPEGKGKPAHAGPSPFIRFPVPQQSVGVVPRSQAAAVAEPRAGGLAGKSFNDVAGVNSPAGVESPSGAFSANAAKLPEPVVLASGAGPSPAQKKAPPPECGAR